jgi:hypothetical protein
MNVTVLVCVAGFGEKVAVTPLGKPETDKLTEPVNPLLPFTKIALLARLPCLIDKLDGEAASVKEGAGFTTRLTEALTVV